jgi:DNA-binding SARP family transcriptional activator
MDDVHLLEGSEAEGALAALVARLPTPWRLVMASRINLAVDLSRLRVSGDVVDIGPDELRFRTWEVEELFRDVYGEPLLPEDVAALTRRTSGWAAYLQMFFLATSRRPVSERRTVLGSLQHRTRLVSEYLARHVLAGLDPTLQDFLIRTSPLRRPTARLCDEFLGREGSAELLAELERRQVFTERLADDSYRYHAVLVAYLDGKLVENLGLDAARGEHRRAGELLERQGWLEEALAAYARSEDWTSLARVLEGLGAEHADMDEGWAEALPPGVLESDALLLMAQARSALSRGALAEAARVLRQAESVAPSTTVAARCRAEREHILAWVEPDRAPAVDWLGVIRRAGQRQPVEAMRVAASLPGVTGRFAEGAAAFAAGDALSCSKVMRTVSAHPDAPKPVAVAAGLMAALCAGQLGRPVAGDVLARVREESESSGLRWLSRMVRAALLPNDDAAEDAVEDLVAACEREGDHWGAAVITAVGGVRGLLRRAPDAAATLGRAADLFGQLGAGVFEATVSAYAAAAAVASAQADRAREHAARARSLASVLDAPAAGALAAAAVAVMDGDDRALAGARRILEALGTWDWQSALVVANGTAPAETTALAAGESAGDGAGEEAGVPGRLRCLGGYVLQIGGRQVDDTSAKPMERALLHLLSIQAGTGVHRESLVASLWPDADSEAGLHRLQVAVSSLRRLLGATGLDGNEVVARTGDAYRLAMPVGSDLDVERFQDAAARAETARTARDVAAERRALDEAFALYAGPLLPGDGPAEWVIEPRRWLVGLYADVTARLTARLLDDEDPRQAVRVARAGLSADRYRDDLWKLLIDSAEAAGNYAEAEQARRDYEGVLSDLGV